MQKIAVVTGANRGMGFETCRQLARLGIHTILTSRSREEGEKAYKKLVGEGLPVEFYPLDVTEDKSIKTLSKFIEQRFGHIEILINNAGIMIDSDELLDKNSIVAIRKTIETNTLGPIRMCQALVPFMKKQNYGRVVNVSSIMGQLSSMSGGYPGYRISKTALNAVTRIIASEVSGFNIKVNSVHPGWVKTQMGGDSAPRSVEQGVQTTIWLATLPDNGPSGKFFYDKKEIEW